VPCSCRGGEDLLAANLLPLTGVCRQLLWFWQGNVAAWLIRLPRIYTEANVMRHALAPPPLLVLLLSGSLEDAWRTIHLLEHGDVHWRVAVVAEDGDEKGLADRADSSIHDSRPDLILLDIESVAFSRRVLAEIRANEALTELPVLLLTVSLGREAVQETQRLAADGFFTKPGNSEEFMTLTASLRRSQIPDVAVPAVGYAVGECCV